jgi:hypothetical protein
VARKVDKTFDTALIAAAVAGQEVVAQEVMVTTPAYRRSGRDSDVGVMLLSLSPM